MNECVALPASRLGNSLIFVGPVKRSLGQRFWLEQMKFR